MARSRATTKSRRLRYSASITPTESCGPRNASTAAFCAIDVGLEVEWLCSLFMAVTIGGGTRAYPMRQPVMAYVFETVPATSTVSFAPGIDAMEYGSLSYRNFE